MVIAIIYFFLIFSFLTVQLYLLWLTSGRHGSFGRSKSPQNDQQSDIRPSVSVLIPVYNEESNIGGCIRSLIDQNYPSTLFEIIVINDHSTDRTVEVASAFPDVKVVNQKEGDRGKKAALTTGVGIATGQVILTIDGDCEVGLDWIVTMLKEMDNDAQVLATGPVWMVPDSPGFLQKYQEMEQSALNLLTYSGLKSGIILSAIGANMGYYRSFFYEIGPYSGNEQISSGDDVFFAQKVHQSGGEVRFVRQREAIVYTNSLNSFSDFIRQRVRWSAKSSAYTHWPTKLYLGAFAAVNLSFVVLLIGGFWNPVFFSYLFYGLLMKFIVDYLFINSGMRWGNRPVCWQDVLKASLFQVGYVVWILILVAVGKTPNGKVDRWEKK